VNFPLSTYSALGTKNVSRENEIVCEGLFVRPCGAECWIGLELLDPGRSVLITWHLQFIFARNCSRWIPRGAFIRLRCCRRISLRNKGTVQSVNLLDGRSLTAFLEVVHSRSPLKFGLGVL
jgi:hypothetical protein